MLDWLMKERQDVSKRLMTNQQEALRLQGALATLEEAIKQARSSGAAPLPPPATTASAPRPEPTAAQQMTALRVGVGPVQADEELRE